MPTYSFLLASLLGVFSIFAAQTAQAAPPARSFTGVWPGIGICDPAERPPVDSLQQMVTDRAARYCRAIPKVISTWSYRCDGTSWSGTARFSCNEPGHQWEERVSTPFDQDPRRPRHQPVSGQTTRQWWLDLKVSTDMAGGHAGTPSWFFPHLQDTADSRCASGTALPVSMLDYGIRDLSATDPTYTIFLWATYECVE